jgi:hypothetical protein
MADLDAARAAKLVLSRALASDRRVSAVGIGGTRDHYVVRVHIVSDSQRPDLPTEVEGVPVEAVVVGRIAAQARH